MIAIIEGCGSNLASVQFALERLGKKSVITSDAATIKAASHVLLPGVSTAKQAMTQLNNRKLVPVIQQLTQPVLGLCLGMQLLFESSDEGNVACLNLIPGKIQMLPQHLGLTIPEMGWNQINIINRDSPLLKDIPDQSYFYFVHSYVAPVNANTLASTDYGQAFASIVQHKNFFGAQFHPERSGEIGALLLQNFLNME